MSKTIKGKTDQFINKLKKTDIPITAIYLFGSQANRKAHKDSDIDICVISDIFGKDFTRETVRLRTIALAVDTRIIPVPMNSDDFIDPYSILASEIHKTGIKLA